jgi:hypothetical protein
VQPFRGAFRCFPERRKPRTEVTEFTEGLTDIEGEGKKPQISQITQRTETKGARGSAPLLALTLATGEPSTFPPPICEICEICGFKSGLEFEFG